MKRVLFLLAGFALAALCGFLPWKSGDAADLIPVETLLVDYKDGEVQLFAANGLEGQGKDFGSAMEKMQSQAPGNLFFGQVARVVAGQQAVALLPGAAKDGFLRLNAAVYRCMYAGQMSDEIEDLEAYWRAGEQRGRLTSMLQYCADGTLPIYINEEGRYE